MCCTIKLINMAQQRLQQSSYFVKTQVAINHGRLQSSFSTNNVCRVALTDARHWIQTMHLSCDPLHPSNTKQYMFLHRTGHLMLRSKRPKWYGHKTGYVKYESFCHPERIFFHNYKNEGLSTANCISPLNFQFHSKVQHYYSVCCMHLFPHKQWSHITAWKTVGNLVILCKLYM